MADEQKPRSDIWKYLFIGTVILVVGGIILFGLAVLGIVGFAVLLGQQNSTVSQPASQPVAQTCQDGTGNGTCSLTLPWFCKDGELVQNAIMCGCPAGQETSGADLMNCSVPQKVGKTVTYNFTSHKNTDPFYGMYCDKINPYDLTVREAASDAIRKDAGAYDTTQLFDIYDWVKGNVIYQNVPLAGIPYPPTETLATKSGDCKNQAVLIASMVEAIGGTAEVVAEPGCVHAYAIVHFGPAGSNMSWFTQAVADHYGSGISVNYFTIEDGIWVIFDPAGGNYPGETLPECLGDLDHYIITGCMECSNTFTNTPYTFGDRCYGQCPSGTISANKYACTPCPAGDNSWNDQCYMPCPYGSYFDSGYCRRR
jgi:hypothetical protein